MKSRFNTGMDCNASDVRLIFFGNSMLSWEVATPRLRLLVRYQFREVHPCTMAFPFTKIGYLGFYILLLYVANLLMSVERVPMESDHWGLWVMNDASD